jgi:acetyl-CoA synthetase
MSAAPDSAGGPSAEPSDPSGVVEGSATPVAAAGDSVTPRSSSAALVFDDPLDRPSADDTDRGWGDHSAADDDFVRFLNEKPPHHL